MREPAEALFDGGVGLEAEVVYERRDVRVGLIDIAGLHGGKDLLRRAVNNALRHEAALQRLNEVVKDEIYFYNDYEVLAPQIIEDFHPTLNADYTTNIVKQCLAIRNGECEYLNYAKLRDFIEKISASDN